jgi:tetratricopeptide (TPR) repeat protein
MVQVKESSFQEVKSHYETLKTDLIKMEYLESVLKVLTMSIDVKKYALGLLAELYDSRTMYDKAAKAMYSKAGYDVTFREKIENLLKSAEYYIKAGNILSAEDTFVGAMREATPDQQVKILATKKALYLKIADELEKRTRMSNAAKLYEHLLTLKLTDMEKDSVKKKLKEYYIRVGRFNEAKMVEKR